MKLYLNIAPCTRLATVTNQDTNEVEIFEFNSTRALLKIEDAVDNHNNGSRTFANMEELYIHLTTCGV
ncbi:hypothetical protein JCM19241_4311 [Vibrio ishigakensis]|uniref:Uncharacterized protein n=1 Tax=Vibrio ishigakensis TaxID=1481914 RepID=A0A0B8QR23_9VIBR|nr:hypothetical protein JCM19241_4311 [Vibrio ishigakensis]